jgi:protein-tyrosine phosphatase
LKNILFVCSGNTCRSPLAEGIARKIFPDRSATSVEVSSVGSSALEGMPASAHAVEVASRHEIDLTTHQSRLLSRTVIKAADLIVTMGEKHRSTVGVIEPNALGYTVLLTEFCDERGEVPDPIGGGIEDYESAFELIRRCVEALAARLDDYEGWKKTGIS